MTPLRNTSRRVSSLVNGPRGRFLLINALLFLLVGWSYLTTPTAGRSKAFGWLPSWFDPAYLGLPWIVAALLAATCSLTVVRLRTDKIGFIALYGVLSVWCAHFFVVWVAGVSPTAWISAVLYGGYAALIVNGSGWSNPLPVPELPRRMEDQ